MPVRKTILHANIAAYGEDEAGELYAVSITGNTVYSISATGNSALPITLINFSAKQFPGYNEIKWSTSFEQNADKYIIEYSKDGSSYTEAGNVMARNSPSGYSYLFHHNYKRCR